MSSWTSTWRRCFALEPPPDWGDAASFNRAEVDALIAEKQQAVDAAATPAEKAALTNELDAWKKTQP